MLVRDTMGRRKRLLVEINRLFNLFSLIALFKNSTINNQRHIVNKYIFGLIVTSAISAISVQYICVSLT